jgi:hypothetical protein
MKLSTSASLISSLVGEEISEADVDNFMQYFGQRWVGQAHR